MSETITKDRINLLNSKQKSRRPIALVMHSLLRNPLALIGFTIFLLMVLVSVFAPLIAPYDPLALDAKNMLKAPSKEHLLGTDDMGRDLLSRMVWGGRESLKTGYLAVLIGMTGGAIVGLFSGFYGGLVDNVVQRIVEVFMAFPNILLTISIVAILGPGLTSVMLAIGFERIPGYSRMVRGSVLDAKTYDYVISARLVGAKNWRIMMRHILPNILGPIIIYLFLGLGGSIAMTAGLSYLGLGAQPPSAEWGAMLNIGRNYMRIAPWMSLWPGVAIALSVFSLNLFGDALRDALDPKSRAV